ncbi:hypothetical protein [Prosthecobacter sp.]|uniref:hypothetical protein n=1 Tax=Prosthecobacter sp. TaxID=1965333 RepID=UPI00378446FC
MPEEDQARAGEGEAEKMLLNEYGRRPWFVYLGLAGMVLFVAAVVLNGVLPGRVTVLMRHGVVMGAHLMGVIAGGVSLFLARSSLSLRDRQRMLRWVTLLNAVFFVVFAYRTWVLWESQGR